MMILSPCAEVVFQDHTAVPQHSSPLSKCQRPTLYAPSSTAALFLISLVCLLVTISLRHGFHPRNMQVGDIRRASDNTNLLPLKEKSYQHAFTLR